MRVVERGTQEVVHRRVDDGELPRPGAPLLEEHAGQQHRGVGDQQAPRLEEDLRLDAAERFREGAAVDVRRGWLGSLAVRHAEAPADVHMADVVTVAA